MKSDKERWLAFAGQDLRMAELAMPEGLWNQVCFHAQQCVEKALKALLAECGLVSPRTHKITDLLGAFPGEEPPTIAMPDALWLLDRYYVATRYPDALPGTLAEGLPTAADAEEALALAREVMSKIKN